MTNKQSSDHTWELIKKAAVDSLTTPGGNKVELPKDKVGPKDNFFIVFRHGESEDNIARIFSGWRDAKLTQKGIDNAKHLSEKVKLLHLDLVITSDLTRSKDTAKYVLDGNFPNIKWEEDWRIKERNYGDLTGQSKEEWMKKDPENTIKWRRSFDVPPPNGESLKMVIDNRIRPFLNELISRIKNEKINVALSAHGNSMRAIRYIMENMDVVTACTHENPLATDYALYVV